MQDKAEIVRAFTPKAVLEAITPEAVKAISHCNAADNMIGIRSFPFDVGRESRIGIVAGRREVMERRKSGDETPNNHLYLVDLGEPLNVSREHFRIERTDTGYTLTDRGSACGTGVNDRRLGGHDSVAAGALEDGDVIAVGVSSTPYLFRFIALAAG